MPGGLGGRTSTVAHVGRFCCPAFKMANFTGNDSAHDASSMSSVRVYVAGAWPNIPLPTTMADKMWPFF